jgi:4-amino-4-deoxy-L-arabinose transferase-like glycosyltransferase
MFGDSFGTEVSWLLPAALIALVGGLWLTRRAPRTDKVRAGLLLWGGWLVATALVFSYMSGTVHPYYAVALAPAIAGLVGIGVRVCWQRRTDLVARLVLAAMTAATGIWDYVLLGRTPDFVPWLRFVVLALGLLVAAILVVGVRRLGRLVPAVVVTVVLALGVGTSAYAVSTASQTHSGSIPTSGPSTSAMGGFGGGAGGPGGRQGGVGGTRPDQSTVQAQGAPGGGGGDVQAGSELSALLAKTTSIWAAATNGSQSAATLELASGKAVIGIGGWSGGDNAPTLAQFQQYVAEGKVSYYVAGGHDQGGSASSGSQILAWVTANFTAQTVGGTTVYDLTS